MNSCVRHIMIAITTLCGCGELPAQTMECGYIAKASESDPYPELDLHRDCGRVSGDGVQLSPTHLRNLHTGKNGLGFVFAEAGVFYVDESGKSVRTLFYDSGPDYFREGLARGIVSNKVGFIDESLDFAIQPRFDFAYPFVAGYAVVCNGCQEAADPEGEHRMSVGGVWGVIDKKGKIVIPLEYGKAELRASSAYLKLGQNSD